MLQAKHLVCILNNHYVFVILGFPGGSVKNPPTNAGDAGSIPGSGQSPGKEKVTHSRILAWEIPWTEEPGRASVRGIAKSGT